MGQITSSVLGRSGLNRRDGRSEEDPEQQLAFSSSNGSYFGSHFLMCGCKFELAKPEAYLFGENSDLDQLGTKALNFPYPLGPLGNDEIRPLNLLVNIRKESIKFQRIRRDDGTLENNLYQLNCVIDADCPCVVQVHFHAREIYIENEIQFSYRNKRKLCSELYNFDIGAEQTFNNFIFDASQWNLSELSYTSGLYFPFVISIQTQGMENIQTQTTMCTIDLTNDTSKSVVLKPLRQRIACDGVSYLLQEIFGIENKEFQISDGDDGGLECIICMSDIRDTVILPCRHLCICSNCADTLRYKLNNCPICRSPFRALIRLRAHRQTRSQIYETISLVEGLNGTHGTSTSGETVILNGSGRRRPQLNRSRGAVHQVLTMEQLSDEKPIDGECIEMTFIANDIDEVCDQEDEPNRIDEECKPTVKPIQASPIEELKEACKKIEDECTVNESSIEEEYNEEEEDENDEEEEEEEKQNLKREKRKSLQAGSRNSSSQLLENNLK